jgi:hypothetical protein
MSNSPEVTLRIVCGLDVLGPVKNKAQAQTPTAGQQPMSILFADDYPRSRWYE